MRQLGRVISSRLQSWPGKHNGRVSFKRTEKCATSAIIYRDQLRAKVPSALLKDVLNSFNAAGDQSKRSCPIYYIYGSDTGISCGNRLCVYTQKKKKMQGSTAGISALKRRRGNMLCGVGAFWPVACDFVDLFLSREREEEAERRRRDLSGIYTLARALARWLTCCSRLNRRGGCGGGRIKNKKRGARSIPWETATPRSATATPNPACASPLRLYYLSLRIFRERNDGMRVLYLYIYVCVFIYIYARSHVRQIHRFDPVLRKSAYILGQDKKGPADALHKSHCCGGVYVFLRR